MKVNKQLKVRFWTPGIIVGESWDRPLESVVLTDVEWPDKAYAFEIIESSVVVTEEGVECAGERKVDEKLYWHPSSKIKTQQEVSKTKGNTILLQNMENNGWEAVIFTRWGNWPQPYDKDRDEVLPSLEYKNGGAKNGN